MFFTAKRGFVDMNPMIKLTMSLIEKGKTNILSDQGEIVAKRGAWTGKVGLGRLDPGCRQPPWECPRFFCPPSTWSTVHCTCTLVLNFFNHIPNKPPPPL